MKWIVLLLLSTLGVRGERIMPDGYVVVGCPDIPASRLQYMDADLEPVYKEWTEYLQRVDYWRGRDSAACLSFGLQMLGILEIALNQDTLRAYQRFRSAVTLNRRSHLFDLGVPLQIQHVWDEAERGYAPLFNSHRQIWDEHWVPPINSFPTRERKLLDLRRLYHTTRSLYGIADNDEYWVKILEDCRSQKDPAFILLRASAMLRLDYTAKRVAREIQASENSESRLVRSEYLALWRENLKTVLRIEHPKYRLEPPAPKNNRQDPPLPNLPLLTTLPVE